VKFASPAIEKGFREALHPDVRAALADADAFCKAQGWPELYLTHLRRTDDDQERIYLPVAKRLIAQLQAGAKMKDHDRVLAQALAAMDEAGLRAWARGKFSWHKCLCAVDVRNRVFSRQQRKLLMERLRKGRPAVMWELLEHDVGHGDHIHVGKRDFAWRKAGGNPGAPQESAFDVERPASASPAVRDFVPLAPPKRTA